MNHYFIHRKHLITSIKRHAEDIISYSIAVVTHESRLFLSPSNLHHSTRNYCCFVVPSTSFNTNQKTCLLFSYFLIKFIPYCAVDRTDSNEYESQRASQPSDDILRYSLTSVLFNITLMSSNFVVS